MLRPPVTQERTGWRDQAMSARHRSWGYEQPAVDLDFILIEYWNATAEVLIDYKKETAMPDDFTKPNWKALAGLGTSAGIPVLCVHYAEDFSWWEVHAVNDLARAWFSKDAKMSEGSYQCLLWRMRRRLRPAIPFDGSKEISHRPEDD